MVVLFRFVLRFLACLSFVLVKLGFAYVVYIGFDWTYEKMLTKKRRGRLLMCHSNKFLCSLLAEDIWITVWPWIRDLCNKVLVLSRVLLSRAGCFHFKFSLHFLSELLVQVLYNIWASEERLAIAIKEIWFRIYRWIYTWGLGGNILHTGFGSWPWFNLAVEITWLWKLCWQFSNVFRKLSKISFVIMLQRRMYDTAGTLLQK